MISQRQTRPGPVSGRQEKRDPPDYSYDNLRAPPVEAG